jgi:hypothetical protein
VRSRGLNVATSRRARIPRTLTDAAPPSCAPVFLHLAYEEVASWRRGESVSPLARSAANGLVLKLAVPMTLNNLAGGIATGIAGVSPIIAGGAAFGASFVMMAAGHCLGRTCAHSVERSVDPRVLSTLVFVTLAFLQLKDALAAAFASAH